MLMAHADVKDGRLTFDSGANYKVLVLPAFDTMTPALLEKIASLLTDGAIVVGGPPVRSPSLSDYPRCDAAVRTLAAKIWGTLETPASITERTHGKGKIYWGGELSRRDTLGLYPSYDATARLLKDLGVAEDFTSPAPLRYAHRTLDESELYFVSNTTAATVNANCIFNVKEGEPELWDPLTGQIATLRQFKQNEGRTTIPLRFAPHQSFFVLFDKTVEGTPNSNPSVRNFEEAPQQAIVGGPWKVSFDTAWGGPREATFDTLQDWSTRAEKGIKYYSGTATYQTSFLLPERPGARMRLDLGEVHCIARVRVNGVDLGIVWCAPWQVDITRIAKRGENQLEIDVANLWVNRLIGDEALPDDHIKRMKFPDWLLNGKPRTSGRYTFSPIKFYKADSPLQKSGLVGPVQILYGEPNI
jgi:hypothetical protein